MNVRSFLRCDVITFEDFRKFGGDFFKLNLDRKIRAQGKRYVVYDGEILSFKIKLGGRGTTN